MQEFAVINRFFTNLGPETQEVVKALGDDCALLQMNAQELLAISVDTSVAGRHFPVQADPWAIGWRCLAIAMSDLAAMGARPVGFTLAITVPEINPAWLSEFSQGLQALAQQLNCSLIGGDTTQGPLSLTVQVHGAVQKGINWRRSSAQVGDKIVLIGKVGLASLGLERMLQTPELAKRRQAWLNPEQAYMLPKPLIQEALSLVDAAIKVRAAIDISDGLLADLQHILTASNLGAVLDLAQIPIPEELLAVYTPEQALAACLNAGDDYALLLTLPATEVSLVTSLIKDFALIGECVIGTGITDAQGQVITPAGYQHFIS